MKSEWKVKKNPMSPEKPYCIFRIRDTSREVHSGNIEDYGEYMESKEEAQAIADRLNGEEKNEKRLNR